jgi:hypothetical protein
LKQDLRSAHFNLGNDKPLYQSSTKIALIEYDINDKKNKQEADGICSKVQKDHFTIGDEKKRDLKHASSTYKVSISD